MTITTPDSRLAYSEIPPREQGVGASHPLLSQIPMVASPSSAVDQVLGRLVSGTAGAADDLFRLMRAGAPVLQRALGLGVSRTVSGVPVLGAILDVLLNAPPAGSPLEDVIVAQINTLEQMRQAFPGQLEIMRGPDGMLQGLHNRHSGVVVAHRNPDGTFRLNRNLNPDLTFTPLSGHAAKGTPQAAFGSSPGSYRLPAAAARVESVPNPTPARPVSASEARVGPALSPEERTRIIRHAQIEINLTAVTGGLGEAAQGALWDAIGARYWGEVRAGRRSGTDQDQEVFLAGLYNVQQGRWTDVAGAIFADAETRMTVQAMNRAGVPSEQRPAFVQSVGEWYRQFSGSPLARGLNALAALPESRQTLSAITRRASELQAEQMLRIVVGESGRVLEAPGQDVQPEDTGNTPTGLRPDLPPIQLPEGTFWPRPVRDTADLGQNIWTTPTDQPHLGPFHTGHGAEDSNPELPGRTELPNPSGPESALPNRSLQEDTQSRPGIGHGEHESAPPIPRDITEDAFTGSIGKAPAIVYGTTHWDNLKRMVQASAFTERSNEIPSSTVDVFNAGDWEIREATFVNVDPIHVRQSSITASYADALLRSSITTLDPGTREMWDKRIGDGLLSRVIGASGEYDIDQVLSRFSGRTDLSDEEQLVDRAFALQKLQVNNLGEAREINGLELVQHLHLGNPNLMPDLIRGGATNFMAVGLGRLPDGSLARIHVYPANAEVVGDANDHSHRTPIRSWILTGGFVNQVSGIMDDQFSDEALFSVNYSRLDSSLENSGRNVDVHPIYRGSFREGETYEMPAFFFGDHPFSVQNVFHRVATIPNEETITLFVFEGTARPGQSFVVENSGVDVIQKERTLGLDDGFRRQFITDLDYRLRDRLMNQTRPQH